MFLPSNIPVVFRFPEAFFLRHKVFESIIRPTPFFRQKALGKGCPFFKNARPTTSSVSGEIESQNRCIGAW